MSADPTAPHTLSDVMDPARGRALQAVLGLPVTVAAGEPLPPFFHHVHFWDAHPPGALGRDGHPAVTGPVAEAGLRRRMWAGGRLDWHGPLRAGVTAERITRRGAPVFKQGRSGRLALVALDHEIVQEGRVVLRERQDLVYREEADPAAPRREPPAAPPGEAVAKLAFDTVLLFRYSALIFYGHRIHYDERYAREVEGYDGLVVHGPLLAQHLVLAARARLGPLASFRYRATAPLMHHERAEIRADGNRLWIAGPGGRLCMEGEAEGV